MAHAAKQEFAIIGLGRFGTSLALTLIVSLHMIVRARPLRRQDVQGRRRALRFTAALLGGVAQVDDERAVGHPLAAGREPLMAAVGAQDAHVVLGRLAELHGRDALADAAVVVGMVEVEQRPA